jgi:hypothetical protein
MLELIPEIDRKAPLSEEILDDPKHPVTLLLVRMYSWECFLYKSVNKASRYGDKTKFKSLGPYAQAMNRIVEWAINYRS